jgi:hypothetical protein
MFAIKEKSRAVPGMVLDRNGELVLAMFSEFAVGVSIVRYDRFLSPDEVNRETQAGSWVTIEREHEELFFVNHEEDGIPEGTHVQLTTEQQRESARCAIEVALLAWPEWSKDVYRQQFEPTKLFMPFRLTLPEA